MREKDLALLKQKVEFVTFGTVSKPGLMSGLKLPGDILMLNINERTSNATLALYRDQLDAEIIIVKGTWTFVPDETSVQSFKKPGVK